MGLAEKLLIVDDDTFTGTLLQEVFGASGYSVTYLDSWSKAEGLTLSDFDVVLLDILMPDHNGLDILRQLRQKFDRLQLPVVLMSSLDDVSDIVDGFELGANDYLIKPLNAKLAKTRVDNHLQLKKASYLQRKADQIQAIHAMIATYNHELNNPMTLAVFQLEKVRELFGEDPSIVELDKSLMKITEIVRKIYNLSHSKNLSFEDYVKGVHMVSLNNEDESN